MLKIEFSRQNLLTKMTDIYFSRSDNRRSHVWHLIRQCYQSSCRQRAFRISYITHRHLSNFCGNTSSNVSCTEIMFRLKTTGSNVFEMNESEAYTWLNFLSNIGGQVSLFCGASIISV